MNFAHIVNPVLVDQSSDLFIAQPITFETMRRAQAYASSSLKVKLYSAQYAEDKVVVPAGFAQTADLDRSVLDVAQFKVQRKLPLLADILERLYSASDADYFIYSNVDIALQPSFYVAVNDFIQAGYDSFVINRRTISADYSAVSEPDQMYADRGVPHRGWDCFVFPRRWYPQFKLFNVCLGARRVGLALLANLVAFSGQFRELQDEHLTFHIGDARGGLKKEFADYHAHNTAELMCILSALEEECGPFPHNSIPGSFLYRRRTLGPLYDAWSRSVYLPAGLSRFINRIFGRR